MLSNAIESLPAFDQAGISTSKLVRFVRIKRPRAFFIHQPAQLPAFDQSLDKTSSVQPNISIVRIHTRSNYNIDTEKIILFFLTTNRSRIRERELVVAIPG